MVIEEEEEEMRDRVVVGYNSIKYLLILIIFILLVIPLIIIDGTYFTANDVGNVWQIKIFHHYDHWILPTRNILSVSLVVIWKLSGIDPSLVQKIKNKNKKMVRKRILTLNNSI